MPYPILLSVAASQKQNAILRIQNCFVRGLVFTTRDFSVIGNQIRNVRQETNNFLKAIPSFASKTYSK